MATLITAILSRLGLTVGTYTSPHLESVRERIAIAETALDEATFAAVLTYLRPFVEQVEAQRDDAVTYFELLNVSRVRSLLRRACVHVAVLEAGLGGEYDATNVADANVGVVVGVSLDHVRQFGDDLRKAAWGESGHRQGGNHDRGVEQDDLFAIVEARAAERGARNVVRLGRDVEVVERRPRTAVRP